ncbi:Sporulation integral membrane protein YlbJ [compost metagenome]
MKNIIQAHPRLISTLAIALGAVMVLTGVLLAPEEVFKASSQGLKLWWTIVFPAMLPFLMLSEMLLALGIVHGLGVLLHDDHMTRNNLICYSSMMIGGLNGRGLRAIHQIDLLSSILSLTAPLQSAVLVLNLSILIKG